MRKIPALSSIVACISSRIAETRSLPGLLAEQVALEPAYLVGGLAGDRGWRLPLRAAGVLRGVPGPPGRRTPDSSGSEFEPSRFAPLMLTQAVSPAAYSPATGVAPSMSVWTPPIM